MSTNYRIDKDLSEASKMADALEEYVRGDQLYGNTGGWFGGSEAALTVGALVMRLRRLAELKSQLNDSQRATLADAQDKHHQVQRNWGLHYEAKVVKEATSRLDAMKTFFKEISDSPNLAPSIYQPELLRRTIVQELTHVMESQRIESAALQNKMRDMDGKLRGVVEAAPFQWDKALQGVYPAGEYWWLYSLPPTDHGIQDV